VAHALYKHIICQTVGWQKTTAVLQLCFKEKSKTTNQGHEMRSPITHVSVSKTTDTSSKCLISFIIWYAIISLFIYDSVVIHSPHPYTVQQNLTAISHNVKTFSSETGTNGSLCEMIK